MAKDLNLSIVIGLKNRASKGLQAIGGQVKNMSSGLTSSLGSSNKLFGATARGLDGLAAVATAVVPQLGIPLLVLNTGIKAAMAGIQAVGGIVAKVFNVAFSVVQKLAGALGDLAKRAFNVAKILVLVGAALAAEAIRRSINAFADYDQAITNAGTTTGLIGAELQKAKEKMFEFGLAVSRTMSLMPTQIAEGFYSLASAGLSVNAIMKATPGILTLAEGTMADVGSTTELVVAAVKSFNLGFEQTNRVVNAFAAGLSASMLTMSRLAVAFPYVAASAANLNISLEQVIATLGVMVDRGVDASMAGTGLRMIFQHLVNPTNNALGALKKYGLTAADVNIAVHGFLPVLAKLQRANLSVADTYKIFEARASTAFMTLMSAGVPAIKDMEKAVTGTNRAFEMQKEQISTAKGLWNILKSTVAEVTIRFGKGLAPAFRAASEWLQRMALRLAELRIGERAGAWVAGLAQRIGELLTQVGQSDAVRRLVNAFIALGAALAGTFSGLAGGFDPAAIIEGIVNRIAMVIEWLTANVFAPGKLQTIVQWFRGMVAGAVTFAGQLAEGISAAIAKVGGVETLLLKVVGYFKWLVAWGQYLVGWFYSNFPSLIDSIVGVLAIVVDSVLAIIQALNSIGAVFNIIFEAIAAVVLNVSAIIVTVFGGAIWAIIRAIGFISPAFKSAADALGAFIVDFDTMAAESWGKIGNNWKAQVDASLKIDDARESVRNMPAQVKPTTDAMRQISTNAPYQPPKPGTPESYMPKSMAPQVKVAFTPPPSRLQPPATTNINANLRDDALAPVTGAIQNAGASIVGAMQRQGTANTGGTQTPGLAAPAQPTGSLTQNRLSPMMDAIRGRGAAMVGAVRRRESFGAAVSASLQAPTVASSVNQSNQQRVNINIDARGSEPAAVTKAVQDALRVERREDRWATAQ